MYEMKAANNTCWIDTHFSLPALIIMNLIIIVGALISTVPPDTSGITLGVTVVVMGAATVGLQCLARRIIRNVGMKSGHNMEWIGMMLSFGAIGYVIGFLTGFSSANASTAGMYWLACAVFTPYIQRIVNAFKDMINAYRKPC